MIEQLQLSMELEVPTLEPHALRTSTWYIDVQGPFIFYPCPSGHEGRKGNLVPIFQ